MVCSLNPLLFRDSERLTKIRDDDRIVLYHTKSLHEETVTSRTYYGFLYHRGPISMVSDPLLFSFVADTTCAQYVYRSFTMRCLLTFIRLECWRSGVTFYQIM